jgi:hypothetical protein
MLFSIVDDMLAIIIERAKVDGKIEGVVPHLVDGRLSVLQYVDDINFCMEHDLENKKCEINFMSFRAIIRSEN